MSSWNKWSSSKKISDFSFVLEKALRSSAAFIYLTIFARILSKEVFSVLSVWISLFAVARIVVMGGYESYLFQKCVRRSRDADLLVWNSFINRWYLCALVAGIFVISLVTQDGGWGGIGDDWLAVVVTLLSFTTIPASIFQDFALGSGNFRIACISSLIFFLVSTVFAFFSGYIYSSDGFLLIALIGYFVPRGVESLYLLWIFPVRRGFDLHKKRLSFDIQLANETKYLLLASTLGTLYTVLDQLLAFSTGIEDATGAYNVVTRIPAVFIVFASSIANAAYFKANSNLDKPRLTLIDADVNKYVAFFVSMCLSLSTSYIYFVVPSYFSKENVILSAIYAFIVGVALLNIYSVKLFIHYGLRKWVLVKTSLSLSLNIVLFVVLKDRLAFFAPALSTLMAESFVCLVASGKIRSIDSNL